MRSIITTFGELVGLAMITAGAWTIGPAVGLTTGGVCLVVVAFVAGDE